MLTYTGNALSVNTHHWKGISYNKHSSRKRNRTPQIWEGNRERNGGGGKVLGHVQRSAFTRRLLACASIKHFLLLPILTPTHPFHPFISQHKHKALAPGTAANKRVGKLLSTSKSNNVLSMYKSQSLFLLTLSANTTRCLLHFLTHNVPSYTAWAVVLPHGSWEHCAQGQGEPWGAGSYYQTQRNNLSFSIWENTWVYFMKVQ